MWELWIISLCTIFVVGFNNLQILLLFEIYHWSFFCIVISNIWFSFLCNFRIGKRLFVCEAKIKYCLPYLPDLSSEVTICCQVAIPGTDGNEHCTSVDGCLKWCWSRVQCIRILGKLGKMTVHLLLLLDTSIRLIFPAEGFHYYHICLNTIQCHFRLFDWRFSYWTFSFIDPKTRISVLNYLI